MKIYYSSMFLRLFVILSIILLNSATAQLIPFAFWNNKCTHTFTQMVEASDKSNGDYFGKGAAFSSDGSTAILGSWRNDYGSYNDAGAAYIFVKSGGVWTEQDILLPTSTVPDGDWFGESVKLSQDGNIAVVASQRQENPGGMTDHGNVEVFTRSGTTWSQQAELLASDRATFDMFGHGVDISDDGKTIIVGAINSDHGGDSDAGGAYIFVESGGVWSQQTKLTASDSGANDNFGHSVAISKDGNTVIVGARRYDTGGNSDAGGAYIFTRSGTTWTQYATVLTASDGDTNDNFGFYVSMSEDGTVAVIGSPYHDDGPSDVGAVYVFRLSGSTWSEEAKLVYSGKSADDQAGKRVEISGNGKYIVAGAENDDESGTNTGAGFLYKHKSGTTWEEVGALKDNVPSSNSSFGTAIGIDKTGTNILIGADRFNSLRGSASFFKCK